MESKGQRWRARSRGGELGTEVEEEHNGQRVRGGGMERGAGRGSVDGEVKGEKRWWG